MHVSDRSLVKFLSDEISKCKLSSHMLGLMLNTHCVL